MSWTIGTVTLPKSPSMIKHPYAAVFDTFKYTGGTAIVLAKGLDIESMTIETVLHQNGYSISQLEGSYLIPLSQYVGSTVAINFPRTRHNGTWLMTSLDPEDSNEKPDNIPITMNFVRGAAIFFM
jgi:hypothetical protein